MGKSALRLVTWVTLYFVVLAFMSVLTEVFDYGWAVNILILFPLTKLLGDLLTMLVQQQRPHSFWEEWLKETIGFAALSIVALVASEFWRNALGITNPPSLVLVAVVAYTFVDSFRRGAKQQSELS